MKNGTQGFTLIELLIVIAIIGILAAVRIPNLLGARKKANDAAASAVARQVLTAMAAVETNANAAAVCNGTAGAVGTSGTAVVTSGTGATGSVIYVNTKATDPEEARVNAPAPITSVTCTNTATGTEFVVNVKYTGGATGSDTTGLTVRAAK